MKERKPALATVRANIQEVCKSSNLIYLDLMAGLDLLRSGTLCLINGIAWSGERLRLNLTKIRMITRLEPSAAIAPAARLVSARVLAQDQAREASRKFQFSDAARPMDQECLRQIFPPRQKLPPGAGGPGMDQGWTRDRHWIDVRD